MTCCCATSKPRASSQLRYDVEALSVFYSLPQEVGERDSVDSFAHVIKAGRELPPFAPHIPLLLRVVAQNGKRQVVVGADPHGGSGQVRF